MGCEKKRAKEVKSHVQINPFEITPVGPLPHILKEDEEIAAVQAVKK